MKIYSMFPDNGHWQFEIFPHISILRVDYTQDSDFTEEEKERMKVDLKLYKYYSINIGWLFWSVNLFIYK